MASGTEQRKGAVLTVDSAAGSDGGSHMDGAGDRVSSSRVTRPPLTALLAEAGVASEEQLRIAVAEGMGSGERLGEVVLRRGWIDEAGLAQVLARQWELAFVDDEPAVIDPHARALVPVEDRERLAACAIGFVDGLPLIAVAEPAEKRFEAVRAKLGGDCRFAVVTKSTLERLLERLASADAEARAAEGSAAATRAAEENDAELLAADLDRATVSLVAFRERVEQLTERQQQTEKDLAEARAQLAALSESRASERAALHSLETELARQRAIASAVKAKLADAARSLEEG
jgi:hypothetical protein